MYNVRTFFLKIYWRLGLPRLLVYVPTIELHPNPRLPQIIGNSVGSHQVLGRRGPRRVNFCGWRIPTSLRGRTSRLRLKG